ncbi:hypothetical protein [Pseudacidovorax intermedius]|uniref:hypothetical protein n=1 Tax=Pseudacidovorax intermedius TaxID=433924 RepID=UPI0026ED8CFE|nr:hypothetical protein [Pseudacidovorax intermedius]
MAHDDHDPDHPRPEAASTYYPEFGIFQGESKAVFVSKPVAAAMILTLDIEKAGISLYIARAMNRGVLVTEPAGYSSIESAIAAEAQAVPDGFAHFMEVRYEGFSGGTELLEALPGKASAIADRLIALVAESHRLAEWEICPT